MTSHVRRCYICGVPEDHKKDIYLTGEPVRTCYPCNWRWISGPKNTKLVVAAALDQARRKKWTELMMRGT